MTSDLHNYRGLGEAPKDFNTFWESAVGEVEPLAGQIPELRKAHYQYNSAECYEMRFEGVFGAKLYAKLLVPRSCFEQEKETKAVLCFHGYGSRSSDWASYLPFVAEGYVVAALDVRGQGGESTVGVLRASNNWLSQFTQGLRDGAESLFFRAVYQDVYLFGRLVRELEWVASESTSVYGASQGGALAIFAAAFLPEVVSAVSIYPFLSDFRGISQSRFFCASAYQELETYFRRYDFCHEHEEQVFSVLDYIDVRYMAEKIEKAKVLLAVALRDTTCPPASQYAVYNRIRAPKELLVYHDFGHEEPLPGILDKSLEWFR